MGVCNCSMFCFTLLYVHFSIAIILMGKRELIALLNLSSWCLVMVERLFLTVPRGCLQFVIVVFPDHTHLLFLRGIRRFFIKKKIELAHSLSAMRVCSYRACVTLQQNQFLLATISHKVKFSKDVVLKLEGIISHKYFLMLFLQPHFSFSKSLENFPLCSFNDLFSVLLESLFFADKHRRAL